MNISKVFIKRPVATITLMMALLMAGLFAYFYKSSREPKSFSYNGFKVYEVLKDSLLTGESVPYNLRERLTTMADQLGVSYYELLEMIRQQVTQ